MNRRNIKYLAVCFTIVVVGGILCLFPNPTRDWHQLKAYAHGPESLVNTNFTGLTGLQIETRRLIKANPKITVERIISYVVRKHVKYTSDYANFHMLDYWADPQETLSRGKEDCDGISILEVSVARSMGYTCGFKVTYDHMEADFKTNKMTWHPIGIIISGLRPSNIRDVAHDVCTAIPGQLACLFGLATVIAIRPTLKLRKNV